jgi:hypothetical protein
MTRFALLFGDGSILALPDDTDFATAQREAEEHDGDTPRTTRVAHVEITVLTEAGVQRYN